RTVARRAQLLREQGVSEDDLARLHSPLGLDLGAETPEETALSILGEIVAARRAGSGAPLRELATPIHGTPRGDSDALGATCSPGSSERAT
ncbi:XdhC family protein, partial [Microbacterium sp.]|uniref:XdhC family protein n=1 Tax=Microbacterium sp. TaxID=51671 RepID=UPI003C279EA9